MMNQTLKNLLIDVAALVSFLVAFEPRLTGETWHEWISLAFGLTIVVHLLLHWNWIVTVGKNYFRNLFQKSRLNFLVDVIGLVAFTLVMLSGLMISRAVLPAIGIQPGEGMAWKMIHKTSADLALIVTAVHVGLHWDWIWGLMRKYVVKPTAKLFTRSMPQAVPVEARKD